MAIERCTPGEIIEVDDVALGGRKIALVDDTGVGYFDLISDVELPKPIYAELNARSLGPLESWLGSAPETQRRGLVQAWVALSARNLDVLTIARALHVGLTQEISDPLELEQQGVAATDRVKRGRDLAGRALRG